VRDFLFRVGGRQFGVPDGERGLPARNPRARDRNLLRDRYRHRRHRGAWLFGTLIGTGSREAVFYGYLAAAVLMLIAVAVVLAFGVNAERKPLEEVAAPLSAGAL